MPANKVYVQQRGNVYTVPLDIATGRAIPVSSVDDDPPGFPFTCTSEAELRAQFPGSEFVFLKEKERPQNVNVPSQEVINQAAAMMKMTNPSNPQAPSKAESVIAVESQRVLEQTALGPKGKAEEFLKRLQTALQYASKKHEKKLQDQVAIIEELIREVF